MFDINSEAFQFYAKNPVPFVEDIIQAEVDGWQSDVLNSLCNEGFVAVRSGSGAGKSVVLSFATIWFICTHPNAKIPTTAPSMHQLYDILWAQHYYWISRSPILKEMLTWTQTKVAMKGSEPNWFAVARTAKVSPGGQVAEGLQGFHATDDSNLLFVVDEASGIQDQVFPAIEGALSGKKAYVILASNPTKRNGYFYDVFNAHSMRGLYELFHISCLDSPRVGRRYIDMMKARYGEDHPIYKIKVEGEFSDSDVGFLLTPDYIETMMNNLRNDVYNSFPIEIGIDVGLSHASSIVMVRQGYNLIDWREYRKQGLVTDTEHIIRWATEIINTYDPARVRVDAIGIGAGVYAALKQIYGEFVVIPVIGGARASNPQEYVNFRAEMYWNLRDVVPKLWCANFPERLIVELSDIRMDQKTGKIRIESKEDMMSRALRSPDFADALCYAFAEKADSYLTDMIQQVPFNKVYVDVNNLAKKESGWVDFNRIGNRWRPMHDRLN